MLKLYISLIKRIYLVLIKVSIKLLQSLQAFGQVLSVDLCIKGVHVSLAKQMSTDDVKPNIKIKNMEIVTMRIVTPKLKEKSVSSLAD